MPEVLCVVTGGRGDAQRARRLLARLDCPVMFFEVDRTLSKRASFRALLAIVRSKNFSLIFLEGTGLVGGLAVIYGAIMRQQVFVISSGDPIAAYFTVTRGRAWGFAAALYEGLLCRLCAGFVGWTPYLTGAALRLGAPTAVTAEGAVDLVQFHPAVGRERADTRALYNIPMHHIVCGLAGSLAWVPKQSYCYGLEMIESLKRVARDDVSIVIIGDGDGRQRLEARVPLNLKARVIFTGYLPHAEVACLLRAIDIGFVTQFGQLGKFRLTTKLPEYLASGLPVAMSPNAGFFDYVGNAGWPLPTAHPSDPEFHSECAAWLDGLTEQDIEDRRQVARLTAELRFDYEIIASRVTLFLNGLLDGDAA